MKRKILNKRVLLLGAMIIATLGFAGCRKYDVPEFVTIEANQTAFLIPLVGDSSNQASFESEELLASARVATKEIQIPHRWVQMGRLSWTGEWRPSAKLIVVDRTPVTREWNSAKDGGTSAQNQAIYAESKESIGFSVGMNISAQIYTEQDAVTFLYSYNNMPLSSIMDTEIRSMVETKFVEKCAAYTLNEILEAKDNILEDIRNEVIPYFEAKGITITVLGMKDGVEYDDENIQAAINEKFSSEQKLTTQNNNNAVAISKAEADAEAAKIAAEAEAEVLRIQAEAEAEANRKIAESLTPELIDKLKYEKWDGQLPVVSGDANTFLDASSLLGH